jgi:hypothetical protein
MIARPDDHALRLVFADWLEEERGWSHRQTAPLRNGSLTGRRPHDWCDKSYFDGFNPICGWFVGDDALPEVVARRLPAYEYRMDRAESYYVSGRTEDSAWDALRVALLAWACRKPARTR